jgi:hypothetical protein
MSFFPADPTKYRPVKVLLRVDLLRELDRAVQEGLGGYANRHEILNELIEQGLVELRYPEDDAPVPPEALTEAEAKASAKRNGTGHSAVSTETPLPTSDVQTISDPSELRIEAPVEGATVVNQLAHVPDEPMFGMHNRDAPTAWALARLATEASEAPISLSQFYETITDEAWKLAAQLAPLETKGGPKLAVMLPRNPQKPQSANDGFRAFALGQVARKADDQGRLFAWGPFYQWGAVGIVGDPADPKIGLTESGWDLVKAFDGLDFALPHSDEISQRFLAHLAQHAPADLWGFQTALDSAAQTHGRLEMNEYFAKRLAESFPHADWKDSVAESVASGYVSRARAWGLIELKLIDRKYALTPTGTRMVEQLALASKTR